MELQLERRVLPSLRGHTEEWWITLNGRGIVGFSGATARQEAEADLQHLRPAVTQLPEMPPDGPADAA